MGKIVICFLVVIAVALFLECIALSPSKPSYGDYYYFHSSKVLTAHFHIYHTTLLSSKYDGLDPELGHLSIDSTASGTRRRLLIQSITGALVTAFPSVSHAGEIGERINRAVTQSDLGIQVRREVVRGAQIMDKLDGQWEQWSDRLQLGAERSKQAKAPGAKQIPPPLPLDSKLAQQCLQICDQAFLDHTKVVSPKELEQAIQRIANLVQRSFERAGLKQSQQNQQQQLSGAAAFGSSSSDILTGEQFNFWSYVHFRAYADLLLTPKLSGQLNKNFASFKARLEKDIGQQILLLLAPHLVTSATTIGGGNEKQNDPSLSSSSSSLRWSNFQSCLTRVDVLLSKLVQAGWVAATDRSKVNEEQLEDWLEGLSDLSLSIALDGDVTLGAQTLLQEQGFRFYPNFGKWAIATVLSQSGETVQVDDYYFDTEYNPDPNEYQVKEVLLNVIVQSS